MSALFIMKKSTNTGLKKKKKKANTGEAKRGRDKLDPNHTLIFVVKKNYLNETCMGNYVRTSMTRILFALSFPLFLPF